MAEMITPQTHRNTSHMIGSVTIQFVPFGKEGSVHRTSQTRFQCSLNILITSKQHQTKPPSNPHQLILRIYSQIINSQNSRITSNQPPRNHQLHARYNLIKPSTTPRSYASHSNSHLSNNHQLDINKPTQSSHHPCRTHTRFLFLHFFKTNNQS